MEPVNVSPADGGKKTLIELAVNSDDAERLMELFAAGKPVTVNGFKVELVAVEERDVSQKQWADPTLEKRGKLKTNREGHDLP